MKAPTSTSTRRLQYRRFPGEYVIVKLRSSDPIPEWAFALGQFCSVTRTTDELSIVCAEESLERRVQDALLTAGGTPALPRWVCLRLEGPFAFTETEVLASFIDPLSHHGIPIFAIATFDTDYVLVPEEHWKAVSEVLTGAGHELID